MKTFSTIILFLIFFGKAGAQQSQPTLDLLLKELHSYKAQDPTRIPLLIRAASLYADSTLVFKPDSIQYFLKQAEDLNALAKDPNWTNRIQVLKARALCRADLKLDARKLFIPLIAECKRSGDKVSEWTAWKYMAEQPGSYPGRDQFRSDCYQHALDLVGQLNDREQEYELLRKLADIHIQQRNFAAAEKELLKTVEINRPASHSSLLFSYDLLTWLYLTKGAYDRALMYGLKTVRTMKTATDSLYALTFYWRLKTIYRDLGNEPATLLWSKRSFEAALKVKSYRPYIVMSGSGVVASLVKLGKAREALDFVINERKNYGPFSTYDEVILLFDMADCYYGLRNYAMAEKAYLQMISLVSQGNSGLLRSQEAKCYLAIGNFYLLRDQHYRARSYLLKAMNGYEKEGSVKDIQNTSLLLFKVDSAAGNYQSAINHLQRSDRLKDSLFNAVKNRQIEELQIAYATEQKDKNISDLENAGKLQALSLKHAESLRTWAVTASCLLLIIAVLLYRQAKVAKKTNTLITGKNEVLQQLVIEKEWLLKEVHHRVKNNLHTVICLLESQAKYLENDALKAVESSQHRIFAMSLIHQKLYRTDNIKTIDMTEYIPELVRNLEASFGVTGFVSFNYAIDPITLNISYAIPLGLIINEAVTNSIKYAFPGFIAGEIHIALVDDDQQIILEISDNGIGMKDDPFRTDHQSLGVELMKGLTAEMNGEISFRNKGGTSIYISFVPALQL